jgi:alanyl-tRNA synthetase
MGNLMEAFYKSAYQKTLQTEILTHSGSDGLHHYTFADTIFYPEGGGQASDLGTINGVTVLDVQKKEGLVWHYLPQPIENPVEMILNWDNRYENMRQHTAQHLLSSLLKKNHDANTISVHLGEDYTAIEIDISELQDDDATALVSAASEVIRKAVPVESFWINKEELPHYDIRRDIKTDAESIRLVQIRDIDLIGCGGTHVATTSEIGLIIYLGKEKIKEGLRLKFKSGLKAEQYLLTTIANNHKISTLLSVEHDATAGAVAELLEKQKQLYWEKQQLTSKLIKTKIPSARPQERYPVVGLTYGDMKQLQKFAGEWIERWPGNMIALQSKDEKINIIIKSNSGDAKTCLQIIQANFSIRGGGTPEQVQGSFHFKEGKTPELEHLRQQISDLLNAETNLQQ